MLTKCCLYCPLAKYVLLVLFVLTYIETKIPRILKQIILSLSGQKDVIWLHFLLSIKIFILIMVMHKDVNEEG